MDYFLFALAVLGVATCVTALLALLPPTLLTTRLANALGPMGAAIGCLAGLCGVINTADLPAGMVTLPWGLPIGQCVLGIDPLSRLFLLPVFGLGFVCALSGHVSLRHTSPGEHNLGAHWLFYQLLILGMAMVIMARDAVLFLFSWEIMSLAPFFLIDFNDGDRLVRDASWVYLVAAHLGAIFLFGLFTLLWDLTGSTSFTAFTALGHTALTPVLFLLAMIGFGAKAGISPLHIWLPEAHPAAPSHVSAIMSGAMINAGLYGIIRSLSFLGPVPEFSPWWGWGVLAFGVGTGLMGILKAMAQSNMKRMLAYSSVENMGVMLMGTGTGLIGLILGNSWIATLGFAGALFHMLNHASFKGLLFLCAGEVLHATGTVSMSNLGGLQKKMPFVGALFALGAAAISCLPPLNGFAGELVLGLSFARGTALSGLENQLGLLFALAALALISGCSVATFAKAYGIAFLGEPRTGLAEHCSAPSTTSLLPLLVPALFCVLGGLPQCFSFVISAVLSVINMPPQLQAEAMQSLASAQSALGTVAAVGFSGASASLAFMAVRWLLLRKRSVRTATTWSCGYQYGTPRIQYTDASFSEPLAKLFQGAMGLRIRREMDSGTVFPAEGHLSIAAPDRLLRRLYTPLFEAFERICDDLKILQHGRIHLYILYILVTLIVLLFWGFWGGNA